MSQEIKNSAGHAIDNGKARLDAGCKALFEAPHIAAFICKHCIPDFAGMSVDEVVNYLVGKPEIGSCPVDDYPDKVTMLNTESKSVVEQVVNFDALFTVRLPSSGKTAKVIVNVEAQNNFNPGYALPTRANYYAARLLSSQKGRTFSNSEYDKLEKVYSIWLCISPDKDARGIFNRYEIAEKCIVGNYHFPKEDYDKVSISIFGLNDMNSANDVIRFFSVIYDESASKNEKHDIAADCGIKLTRAVEGGIDEMCDYSNYVEQKGIEKGIAQGQTEGRASNAVSNVVNMTKALGRSVEDVVTMMGIDADIRDEVVTKAKDILAIS